MPDGAGGVVQLVDVVEFVAQKIAAPDERGDHLLRRRLLADVHGGHAPRRRQRGPLRPDREQLIASRLVANAVSPAGIDVFAVAPEGQRLGVDDLHVVGRRRIGRAEAKLDGVQ